MSKVLLVGVDCSSCSDRALAYAADRADASKAQLIVVHVIDWSPFSFNTPQENEERQWSANSGQKAFSRGALSVTATRQKHFAL